MSLFKQKYTDKKTGKLKQSRKWYTEITDENGIRKRIALSPNRTVAEQMRAELLRKIENAKIGIRDPYEEHRQKLLKDHLADWETSLRANDASEDYILLKTTRVRQLIEGCQFIFLVDLSAERVEQFLKKLRTEKKRSVQTTNDWLQAIKQFTRWLLENDRINRNPFLRLKGGNVAVDRRHERRILSNQELSQLLQKTRSSPTCFRRLTGEDRYHIYLTAISTGFRAKEIAFLTPNSFDLDATPPIAHMKAKNAKNKRYACQPLPDELVEALKVYLSKKPINQRIWKGSWWDRAADMLKIDLESAGISFKVDGKVFDFHAFRGQFITRLEQAGLSPKVAQELARHSDARLTLERYTKKTVDDLANAIQNVPRIVNHPNNKENAVTQNPNASSDGLQKTYKELTGTNDLDCNSVIPSESGEISEENSQTPDVQGVEVICEEVIEDERKPPQGFEPWTPALRKRCTTAVLRRRYVILSDESLSEQMLSLRKQYTVVLHRLDL
jgi:integrase